MKPRESRQFCQRSGSWHEQISLGCLNQCRKAEHSLQSRVCCYAPPLTDASVDQKSALVTVFAGRVVVGCAVSSARRAQIAAAGPVCAFARWETLHETWSGILRALQLKDDLTWCAALRKCAGLTLAAASNADISRVAAVGTLGNGPVRASCCGRSEEAHRLCVEAVGAAVAVEMTSAHVTSGR